MRTRPVVSSYLVSFLLQGVCKNEHIFVWLLVKLQILLHTYIKLVPGHFLHSFEGLDYMSFIGLASPARQQPMLNSKCGWAQGVLRPAAQRPLCPSVPSIYISLELSCLGGGNFTAQSVSDKRIGPTSQCGQNWCYLVSLWVLQKLPYDEKSQRSDCSWTRCFAVDGNDFGSGSP